MADVVIAYFDQLHPVIGGGPERVLGIVRFLRERGVRVHLVNMYHEQTDYEMLGVYFESITTANRADGVIKRKFFKGYKKVFGWRIVKGENVECFVRDVKCVKDEFAKENQGQMMSMLYRKREAAFDCAVFGLTSRIHPDAVISQFAWTSCCLKYLPPFVRRIVDTHDIQHLRRATAQRWGTDLPGHNVSYEEEVSILGYADEVLAIQGEERDLLAKMCPGKRVTCIKHSRELDFSNHDLEAMRKKILFVGNAYIPNIMGLQRFLDESWPQVVKAIPDVELLVVGKVCEQIGDYPSLQKLGCVEEMKDAYRNVGLVINPVEFGSGLKIKSVEALCYGKILLATDEALRGFEKEDFDEDLCCDVSEMSSVLIQLLSDEAYYLKKMESCRSYARKHLSPSVVYNPLIELINEV